MRTKLEGYTAEADKACCGTLKDFSFKVPEMQQTLSQAQKALDLVDTMLACAPAAGWTTDSASSSGEDPKKKKNKRRSRKNARAIA